MRTPWRAPLAACCLITLAVSGSHPPGEHTADAARIAPPVPVLRLAIDNDYYRPVTKFLTKTYNVPDN